jgi:fatty acid desaturase
MVRARTIISTLGNEKTMIVTKHIAPRSAPELSANVTTDLALASKIARQFYKRQQSNPRWRRLRNWADIRLQGEWIGIIAVTYWLIFFANAWYWKLLLVPWSIYSSLALDSIVHYINHWPTFRDQRLNHLWRISGILVFFIPLSIRYHHWAHHQAYDLNDDPQDELRRISEGGFWQKCWALCRYLGRELGSSLKDLLPWTRLPENILRLRTVRPAHYREIVRLQWARLVLLVVLLVFDPFDTICFFVPTVILIPTMASFLMNLTDHLPAQLDHPFRQATYYEPVTWLERSMSAFNHYTAATHLTHHLFPQIHFAFIRQLQRRLIPLYERHGSPQSFIITTILCGNPFSLLLTFLKIIRHSQRVNQGLVQY